MSSSPQPVPVRSAFRNPRLLRPAGHSGTRKNYTQGIGSGWETVKQTGHIWGHSNGMHPWVPRELTGVTARPLSCYEKVMTKRGDSWKLGESTARVSVTSPGRAKSESREPQTSQPHQHPCKRDGACSMEMAFSITDRKVTVSSQHRFMKGKSLLTNPVTFYNKRMGSVETGTAVIVFILILAKLSALSPITHSQINWWSTNQTNVW